MKIDLPCYKKLWHYQNMKPAFIHFSGCEFDSNWEQVPTGPSANIWYEFTAKNDNAALSVTEAHNIDRKLNFVFKKGSKVLINATIIKYDAEDAEKHIEICVSEKS